MFGSGFPPSLTLGKWYGGNHRELCSTKLLIRDLAACKKSPGPCRTFNMRLTGDISPPRNLRAEVGNVVALALSRESSISVIKSNQVTQKGHWNMLGPQKTGHSELLY